MADNVAVTEGSGKTIAGDDVGGAIHQRVKAEWGPDGTVNEVDVASGKPFPVQLRGSDGTDRSNSLPVTITGGGSFATQTTATSGTTGYIPGDVIGGALDFGVLGANAGIVEIVSASLAVFDGTLIAGQGSYRVHLYNVTPPSAIADTAQWDLPSGDRASYQGYIDLNAIADVGSTLYVQEDNIGHRCKLSGTHLFGYLVSNGTYTPTVQSYVVTLHTEPK